MNKIDDEAYVKTQSRMASSLQWRPSSKKKQPVLWNSSGGGLYKRPNRLHFWANSKQDIVKEQEANPIMYLLVKPFTRSKTIQFGWFNRRRKLVIKLTPEQQAQYIQQYNENWLPLTRKLREIGCHRQIQTCCHRVLPSSRSNKTRVEGLNAYNTMKKTPWIAFTPDDISVHHVFDYDNGGRDYNRTMVRCHFRSSYHRLWLRLSRTSPFSNVQKKSESHSNGAEDIRRIFHRRNSHRRLGARHRYYSPCDTSNQCRRCENDQRGKCGAITMGSSAYPNWYLHRPHHVSWTHPFTHRRGRKTPVESCPQRIMGFKGDTGLIHLFHCLTNIFVN